MDAFLRGLASLFDFCGVLHEPRTPMSDAEAIEQAWRSVGDTIREAMQEPPLEL